jgi:hypothetical protein
VSPAGRARAGGTGCRHQPVSAAQQSDRDNLGKTYQTPALLRLCPVQAYIDWLSVSALVRGPVFRGIDRWGNLSEEGSTPTV